MVARARGVLQTAKEENGREGEGRVTGREGEERETNREVALLRFIVSAKHANRTRMRGMVKGGLSGVLGLSFQYLLSYLVLTPSASTINELLKLSLWPQDSKKRPPCDSGRFLRSAMLSRKRRVGRLFTEAKKTGEISISVYI